jgi:dTDP-glucose 4,6-dehydratase
MRAAVAGAAGFIGYHFCQRLLSEGFEVVGLDNFISGQHRNIEDLSREPRFSFIQADVASTFTVPGKIDSVIDLACPASPVDFVPHAVEILDVCSNGVRNLLELARRHQADFVHASTSECYGDPLVHPQHEDYWGNVNPIGLRAPYDEGKRFAEALVMTYHRKHNLPTRLVRIFNTYGSRMRPHDGRVLPNLINQALVGQPLTVYGDGSQTRSFCYVTDLVDGIFRLMRSDYALPVNIGNPVEHTILSIAQKVNEMCGGRSQIGFKPLPADDPKLRCPDITRARKLLGWEPSTPLDTGLRATIDYFKALAATKH